MENRIKHVILKFKSNGGETQSVRKMPSLEIAEENQNEEKCPTNICKQTVNSEFGELENEEWDNVGVYQTYILKQEKELEQKKKKLEQKAIRAQLNNQVLEKEAKINDLKAEKMSYVDLEKQQCQRYLQHQKETLQMKEDEKKEIFNMQTKMIQARNAQLEKKKKLQDEIDKKIMNSIQADLAKKRE